MMTKFREESERPVIEMLHGHWTEERTRKKLVELADSGEWWLIPWVNDYSMALTQYLEETFSSRLTRETYAIYTQPRIVATFHKSAVSVGDMAGALSALGNEQSPKKARKSLKGRDILFVAGPPTEQSDEELAMISAGFAVWMSGAISYGDQDKE